MIAATSDPQPGRAADTFWATFWGPWRIDLSHVDAAQPLRFGLWELLAAITAAAVLLALFRALGIFGALLSFLTAVAFTQWNYPRLTRDSPQKGAAMFDFVWGVVMPVVCLVFDPFVFKSMPIATGNDAIFGLPNGSLVQAFSPFAFPAYGLIGWQIIAMSIWLAAGRMNAPASAFFSGVLWMGQILSVFLGIFMILPATAGLFFHGVGAIGFSPIFTARAFYRRRLEADRRCNSGQSGTWVLFGLGFVASWLPAVVALRLFVLS